MSREKEKGERNSEEEKEKEKEKEKYSFVDYFIRERSKSSLLFFLLEFTLWCVSILAVASFAVIGTAAFLLALKYIFSIGGLI
jgi:hypothetical protein